MGRRKRRSEIAEAPTSRAVGGENDETVREDEGGKFFACYLLTSLSPRHKGQTYIGFTVNPHRRLRQHNGEISCGAWRTKSKRPWEMVLCIYGFPTNVAALQFEWAWQHPIESLAVRKAAASFKSLSGIANKIKLAYTMLTLPAWQSLNLTVNFFSTKYKKHCAGCPSLQEHMKVQVCSMDELPCYPGSDRHVYENDEWDDDGECNENNGTQGSIKEGLAVSTVNNFVDHHNCFEENTREGIERIEEIGMKQPRDSPIQEEDHGQPFESVSGSCNEVATVEDGDMFGLIKEHNIKLDLPTKKRFPTADNNLFLIERTAVPSEIEVIDVLTPSPGYNISSLRKKRRVSTGCPVIIDLTKSPIFV